MTQEEITETFDTPADPRFPNVETYLQTFAAGLNKKGHVIEKILIVSSSNDIAAIQFMRSVRRWALNVFGNERAIQFVVVVLANAAEDRSANQECIRMADHVVQIQSHDSNAKPSVVVDSNVNVHEIVDIARQYKVHAVWYGGWGGEGEGCGDAIVVNPIILSEALATSDPPMKYIGPDASLMKVLEDQIQCTLLAQTVGMPCLSWNGEGILCNVTQERTTGFVSMGSYCDNVRIGSVEEAIHAAENIGFPVRIMDSTVRRNCMEQGAKGIRIVSKVQDMEDAYRQVKDEVPEGTILIRKELSTAVRHLVVPLLADEYGNVVALNGRDCSVQRHHHHEQILVEEAPPSNIVVPTHVWEEMESFAVLLAKQVGFASTGSVEFLYSESDQKYYFVQFTPYLTMGHCVTEMITKVNLPLCQLQVAMGIDLGNIEGIRGLYGMNIDDEDPLRVSTALNLIDFNTMKPSPPVGYCIGIYLTEETNGQQHMVPGADDGIEQLNFSSTQNAWGYMSKTKYDAMGDETNLETIHLFASGNDREEARHNAIVALKELSVRVNVMAKVNYIIKVMEHDDYVSNRIDTQWLDRCDINNDNEVKAEATVEKNVSNTQDVTEATAEKNVSNTKDVTLSDHVKVVIGALIIVHDHFVANEEKHRNNDPATSPESKSQSVLEHTVELILDKTKYILCCRRLELNRFSVSVSGSPEKHLIATIKQDAESSYKIDVGGKNRSAYVNSRAGDSLGLNITIDGIDVSYSHEFETVLIRSKFSGKVTNVLVDDGARLMHGDNICEIDAVNESKTLIATRAGTITWKISNGDTVNEGDTIATIQSDCPQETAATALFEGDLEIEGWCVDSGVNSSKTPYFSFKNPFESFNSGLSGYSLMGQTTFNTAFDDLKKVVGKPLLPEPDYDDDEPSSLSHVRPDVKGKGTPNEPSSPHKDAGAIEMKKKANRNSAVNHDKCLAQLRQLEKEFNAQINEKDVLISEMKEANDDLKRQVDQLTLESEGLNQTIQAGKERLSEVDKKDEEIGSLKALLSEAQDKLATTNESYSTLKSRVKSVATELKERRTECRSLNTTVEELTLTKSTLESELNDYQIRLSKLEILLDEKNKEIESLLSNVADLQSQLKEKEKELSDKASVSEKALDSYKKKAQASLAHANARAAAANQAKEDAEIAATNAINISATALKKAKDAEESRNAVIAKAHDEKTQFLAQMDEYKSLYENVREELSQVKENLKLAEEERSRASKSRDEALEELSSNQKEVDRQHAKCLSLEQDIQLQRCKTQELEEEIRYLKEELDNYASAAFKARQAETAAHTQNDDKLSTSSVAFSPSETDGAIAMLQQELQIANDAIKELKEALGALLSQNPSTIEPKQIIQDLKIDGSPQRGSHLHSNHLSHDETTTESIPLFFAFEKQAELNTARDEITRLAALLGDAESAKVEAFEAMDEMRKKMEEAEARLRRYEKLAPASKPRSGAPHSLSSVNNTIGNHRINGSSPLSASASSRKGGPTSVSQPHNDSTVNLEYLKNIILRFMKATSLNEKRALVPVISAVLELTADEQESALQNLEKSANVTGVGVSLIENIQNKGFHGLFS